MVFYAGLTIFFMAIGFGICDIGKYNQWPAAEQATPLSDRASLIYHVQSSLI